MPPDIGSGDQSADYFVFSVDGVLAEVQAIASFFELRRYNVHCVLA
jgi:hypothetical protein